MSSVPSPVGLPANEAAPASVRPLRIGLMAALHDEISAFLAHIEERHAANGSGALAAEALNGNAPSACVQVAQQPGAQHPVPQSATGAARQSEASIAQGEAASANQSPRTPFVPGTHAVAGRQFHCLRWHGLELVVALAGVGKVAAATTASLMADRFGVQAMAFTGVAGGLAEGVQVGDVVLAQQLLQHDMDASPLFPRHEVPLTGISRFATDAGLSQSLQRAALALLADLPACVGDAVMARYALQQARVHQGLIVSGDRFVATNTEREALLAELPDALAVEMEGAAVAQVCHDFGLPLVVVRTVSDRADDAAHVDFPAFTREVASHYSAQLLRSWLDGLAAGAGQVAANG